MSREIVCVGFCPGLVPLRLGLRALLHVDFFQKRGQVLHGMGGFLLRFSRSGLRHGVALQV
jgi:hypothetical protein